MFTCQNGKNGLGTVGRSPYSYVFNPKPLNWIGELIPYFVQFLRPLDHCDSDGKGLH